MKAFKKEKVLFFWLAIFSYFVPFIIATSILFPRVAVDTGQKWAIGICLILINAIPFLKGVFLQVFVKFPLLNLFSAVFLLLAGFFCMQAFQYYVQCFCWIEAAALAGSILACVFWQKYKKYKGFQVWKKGYDANKKAGEV